MATPTVTKSVRAPIMGLRKGTIAITNGSSTTFGFGYLEGAVVSVNQTGTAVTAGVYVASGSGTVYISNGTTVPTAEYTLSFIAWGS